MTVVLVTLKKATVTFVPMEIYKINDVPQFKIALNLLVH